MVELLRATDAIDDVRERGSVDEAEGAALGGAAGALGEATTAVGTAAAAAAEAIGLLTGSVRVGRRSVRRGAIEPTEVTDAVEVMRERISGSAAPALFAAWAAAGCKKKEKTSLIPLISDIHAAESVVDSA